MVRINTQFSFVIPTYNRADLVRGAIRSALAWLGGLPDGEVIVVDDGSSDGSSDAVRDEFAVELEAGTVRLVTLARNMGVNKAKNAGAREAKGKWIIFLDSDDEMIPESSGGVRRDCAAFSDAALLFFRCRDFLTGQLLGPAQMDPVRVNFREYLNGSGFGECLPVVRKGATVKFPYDERLNGWEGLAYARILRGGGSLVVSPVVARRYRSHGEDRLSSREGMRRRRGSLARGHWLLLLEFGRWLTPPRFALQIAKVLIYRGTSLM